MFYPIHRGEKYDVLPAEASTLCQRVALLPKVFNWTHRNHAEHIAEQDRKAREARSDGSTGSEHIWAAAGVIIIHSTLHVGVVYSFSGSGCWCCCYFFSQIQIFTCRLKNMRFVEKSLEPWQEKEAALKREREEAVKRAENDMTDLERFRMLEPVKSWCFPCLWRLGSKVGIVALLE